MRDYAPKPETGSHTIQNNPKAANQASIADVLQAYAKRMTQMKAREEDEEAPLQTKAENKTGLPDSLKSRVEAASGFNMDDVRVHYNSDKPAQLQAHAYTQGTEIHVAPGQEKHLGHEAWHVVQQMQGRVQPTMQMQGVNVNDNEELEKEADVMGETVQMRRYTITKQFPLNSYGKVPKDEKDRWTKVIDALRTLYPSELKDGKATDKDEKRGNDFLVEKQRLSKEYEQTPYNETALKRAKLSHLSPSKIGGTRTMTMANPVKNLFNKDFKSPINWMGGHLIKDSWGGLDNMMNVAVWDQDNAEKKWSEEFEDPLEAGFLLDPNVTSANVTISMTKEDEILGSEVIPDNSKLNDKDRYHIEQQEKKRWEINNAVETIPLEAHGEFTLNTGYAGRTDINEERTGYNYMKGITSTIFDNFKGKLFKQEPDSRALTKYQKPKNQESPITNDPETFREIVSSTEREKRTKKRIEAMILECQSLGIKPIPPQFFQNIEEDSKFTHYVTPKKE